MNHRSLGRGEKPQLDDGDLQELIEERLGADPVFRFSRERRARVEVEVDDGEVTLHGVVRTALDRRKADILARALGASTVDNQLRVEPEDPQGSPVPITQARARQRGPQRVIVSQATESSSGTRRGARSTREGSR